MGEIEMLDAWRADLDALCGALAKRQRACERKDWLNRMQAVAVPRGYGRLVNNYFNRLSREASTVGTGE